MGDAGDIKPEGFEVMGEFVVLVRDIEKSLRGDAADVEACSSERAPLFDTHRAHAKLGRLDGSNITYMKGVVPPGPPPITARSKARFENA